MNTVKKMKLQNAKEINLTLTYGKLYRLQNTNQEAVDIYNELQAQERGLNEFEILRILYTAFLCADNDIEMSYEEFLDNVVSNRMEILKMYNELMYPKN